MNRVNIYSAVYGHLSIKDKWKRFKIIHNKKYETNAEDKLRCGIFEETLKKIKDHNDKYEAGLKSYYKGVNEFSDLTPDEFSTFFPKKYADEPEFKYSAEKSELKGGAEKPKIIIEKHVPSNVPIPDKMDWRKKGAVLKVKDQRRLKTCWAFSATGALEGQNAIKNKIKIPLSEQQLLDCSRSYGERGSEEEGRITDAFDYYSH